ncbi:hypothetical protein BDE02_09G106600 [Populus trichocarpa]|nr:hypothetical protein BDE02_09G106600 [Populus trichocarpa]
MCCDGCLCYRRLSSQLFLFLCSFPTSSSDRCLWYCHVIVLKVYVPSFNDICILRFEIVKTNHMVLFVCFSTILACSSVLFKY